MKERFTKSFKFPCVLCPFNSQFISLPVKKGFVNSYKLLVTNTCIINVYNLTTCTVLDFACLFPCAL